MAKKSDYKLRIREEARRKVKGPTGGVTGPREYRERVEQQRAQLLRKASEGGDPKVARVKNELMYLLNNYLPQYDHRINMLVDEWRRSGDPDYDPSVKIKVRKARQQHMKDNPY